MLLDNTVIEKPKRRVIIQSTYLDTLKEKASLIHDIALRISALAESDHVNSGFKDGLLSLRPLIFQNLLKLYYSEDFQELRFITGVQEKARFELKGKRIGLAITNNDMFSSNTQFVLKSNTAQSVMPAVKDFCDEMWLIQLQKRTTESGITFASINYEGLSYMCEYDQRLKNIILKGNRIYQNRKNSNVTFLKEFRYVLLPETNSKNQTIDDVIYECIEKLVLSVGEFNR